MAGRPLRPATDRSLGRPLPHQQANRTQATPKAPEGFGPQPICGISPSFPGLSPTSGYVPTRYAPVRRCRCRPRDLHVLSMPPAFALSQDQTLRFIAPTQDRNPAPRKATLTDQAPLTTLDASRAPDAPRTNKPAAEAARHIRQTRQCASLPENLCNCQRTSARTALAARAPTTAGTPN